MSKKRKVTKGNPLKTYATAVPIAKIDEETETPVGFADQTQGCPLGDFFNSRANGEARIRFNHRSTDYGVWVDYNGLRFKDVYSLELKDGAIVEMARPNGDGWYPETRSLLTKEEYEVYEKENRTDQAPRSQLPESECIDKTRWRIDDSQVARVRLVPDAEFGWDSYHYTGIQRIVRNRRYFGDILHPDEDLSIGVPTAARAKFVSLVFMERTQNSESSTPVQYRKPGLFGAPDAPTGWFTKNGLRFTLEQEIELEVCGEYFMAAEVPKLFRRFFQKGGKIRLVLPVKTSVQMGDSIAEFYAKPTTVELLRAPRDSTEDWLSLFQDQTLHGNVHFTFYHDEIPNKEV